MIRKSGNRFSEKIMLKQRDEIMIHIRSDRIMIEAVREFFPKISGRSGRAARTFCRWPSFIDASILSRTKRR
jgi:hypothetical protein